MAYETATLRQRPATEELPCDELPAFSQPGDGSRSSASTDDHGFLGAAQGLLDTVHQGIRIKILSGAGLYRRMPSIFLSYENGVAMLTTNVAAHERGADLNSTAASRTRLSETH